MKRAIIEEKERFTALEGRRVSRKPQEVLFGDYVKDWLKAMQPGMSPSKIRDYRSCLDVHILPYFAERPFSDFNPVRMKKFLAHLQGKRNRCGRALSAKWIQNVMIPLRVIVRDAFDEYCWRDLPDPFGRLKLPAVKKRRVFPFSFSEWQVLMEFVLPWYRPYFEFAVQTGLRPSEQVALKWSAIDADFVHVELSRVRNQEKIELKTEKSRRSIALRPAMRETLEVQRQLTKGFESSYVFVNTEGRPILQDKLREHWSRVMKKSGDIPPDVRKAAHLRLLGAGCR